jgi:peptidoglycan/LPS O-acetylase OafA/YrhL
MGGRIFDETGSYALAWAISIGLSVLAAICSWPVNEKPLARLEVVT